MEALEFLEEDHAYLVGGRRLLSVTQVLAGASMTPPFYGFLVDDQIDRGRRVHTLIERDLLEGLEGWEAEDDIASNVRSWASFRERATLEPWLVEWRSYCPVYGYAGTLDYFGLFGPRGGAATPAIIDWKRAHEDPVHAVQVAGGYLPLVERWVRDEASPAQRALVEQHGIACYGLSLAKPHPWPTRFGEAGQRDVFRAALAVVRWRKQHGR